MKRRNCEVAFDVVVVGHSRRNVQTDFFRTRIRHQRDHCEFSCCCHGATVRHWSTWWPPKNVSCYRIVNNVSKACQSD